MLQKLAGSAVYQYESRRFTGEEAQKLLSHPSSFIGDYLKREGHRVNGVNVLGAVLETAGGPGKPGGFTGNAPEFSIHVEVRHHHFEDGILDSEWIAYLAIVIEY